MKAMRDPPICQDRIGRPRSSALRCQVEKEAGRRRKDTVKAPQDEMEGRRCDEVARFRKQDAVFV